MWVSRDRNASTICVLPGERLHESVILSAVLYLFYVQILLNFMMSPNLDMGIAEVLRGLHV